MTSTSNDEFVQDYVTMLIDAGRSRTAFGEAARWGNVQIVLQMIDEGTQIDGQTESGCTALMLAASGGHDDVIRLLIEKGADVNARDTIHGKTALMWNLCAMHRPQVYLSIAQLLVSAGADLSLTSNDGQTALDCARQHNSEQFDAVLTSG